MQVSFSETAVGELNGSGPDRRQVYMLFVHQLHVLIKASLIRIMW
jgi:hypothetical protein